MIAVQAHQLQGYLGYSSSLLALSSPTYTLSAAYADTNGNRNPQNT